MALCGDGCAVKRSGRAQAPHAPGRSGFWARGGGWVLAQIPVLIGAVMVPSQTADSFSLIGVPAHIIGIAITVTGGIIVLAGALQLGEALTPLPHPRDGARLREEGIYRYMRHPIYSGLIVGSFGWALAWQSPWGIAYVVLVFLFFDRKAAREERWLRARYPGYDGYAQRVRKLFPGVY
jgi:protein-S-isoprenylcysteine O-methyltransferase Ste14